jgi:hypothetical protein
MSRLESVVIPMADKVDSLQQKARDLSQQLDEASRIVKSIALQSPLASPQAPLSPSEHAPTNVEIETEQYPAKDYFSPSELFLVPPPLRPSASQSVASPSSLAMSTTLAASTPRSMVPSPTLSQRRHVSKFSLDTNSEYSASAYSSDEDSTTTTGSHRYAYPRRPHSQRSNHVSILSRSSVDRVSITSRPPSGVLSDMLPPPAMDLPSLEHHYTHGNIEYDMSSLSLQPPKHPGISHLHRSATSSSQKERFENAAIRNAAILCDV